MEHKKDQYQRGIFLGIIFTIFILWSSSLVMADTNVGDIAVIETDPTIIPEGFDLDDTTLEFTPQSGGGYDVQPIPFTFETNVGGDLGLGDDAAVQRNLSFLFPFFGQNQNEVFIGSNGFLTFQGPSSLYNESFTSFAGNSGRIAGLFDDLDPSAGGSVKFNNLGDRAVITWENVPEYGSTNANTFQIVLSNTGTIRMSYNGIAAKDGLVGVSPGGAFELFGTSVDYSVGPTSSVITGFNDSLLIAQVFADPADASFIPFIPIQAVARKFFQTHGDDFDQIAMIADFESDLGNAFAFELTIHSTVQGIGSNNFDASAAYGSGGRLQAFLNMNRLGLYPPDPTQDFLGTNNTLDLMGQESGHQWLAFVQFDDNGLCTNELLGRDNAHWSFFHDTDASVEEGNSYVDNGNGTFTTDEATARFSPLDQYIMGLRTPSEVPEFFFIDNPSGCLQDAASSPAIGVTCSGTRRNVSVNQVITCEGARNPASGLSGVNPTNTVRQAFILLTKPGTNSQGVNAASSADIAKWDGIRAAWVSYFAGATDNRGSIDTSLGVVAPSAFTLTVVKNGNGSGTVTSSPPGITCGTDCSESFSNGTAVTLTAAVDSGSVFTGFSDGGCSGTVPCTVTITAATTVVATFSDDITTGTTIVSAVLPSSRSVQVGTSATFFATIVNAGSSTATACSFSLLSSIPATFSFIATGRGVGPNAPVSIPAGGSQNFVGELTATAPVAPTNVLFNFDCANTPQAANTSGLNTLDFTASSTPVPDIVALAATIQNDGVVHVNSTGVFAVAAVNVGATSTITATADTGTASLPLSVTLCQTNPSTGSCLSPPGSSVTTVIAAGATPTFGVFVTSTGPVPFDPANNRIFVRFRDGGNVTRGSTSVAVEETGSGATGLNMTGNYNLNIRVASTNCPGISPGDQFGGPLNVTQIGPNLTFQDSAGTTLTGELTGTSFTVSGRFSESVPGTSCVLTDRITANGTVNATTLNFSATARESISGNGAARCGGFVSCTVNETYVGTRLRAGQFKALGAAQEATGFEEVLRRLEITGTP